MTSALKTIRASVFLIADALTNRLIGLLSTLILARVLVPADFGLVAIAVLLLGFVEVLGNTAGLQYLLKTDNLTDDHVNTHFTLNLLIQSTLGLIFFLSAPIVAHFYDDQRLILIIQVLFIYLIVRALTNPAEAYLRKKQEYRKIIKVSMITKIISASTAVSIALIYHSYWALLLGQLVSAFGSSIGSYIINPYRPKLTLKYAQDQWSFSAWMIPQSVLGYIRTQLDTLIVSNNFGRDALGSYHVLKYLSYMPLSTIIVPATQPLLVELAQVKDDRNAFSRQFNIGFFGIMMLVIPITTVMFYFDKLIVAVLLGEQWVQYSELLSLLGLLLPATAMLQQANRVLIAYGKTKHLFYYEVISFGLLYTILFFIGFKDVIIFTTWRVGIENVLTFSYMLYTALKYTSASSFLKLTLSTSVIISISLLSGYTGGIYSSITTSNLANLLISLSIYTVTFLILSLATHFSIGKHLDEFQYICTIIARKTLNSKIKNS